MIRRRVQILLTAVAVFVALVVPATSQAATSPPNPSATASVEPLTILQAGFTAFTKFKTCLKNMDVGQPCLASDSDNIRAVLKEVRQLAAQVDAHHKEVTARLQLLQRTLDTSVLDGYINDLRPTVLNGRKALKSWERIAVCMEQSVARRKTCAGLNGAQQRIKVAVAGWKRELIAQANLTPDNVELTGAEFTGTEDRGGENGLAFSAWIVNKRLQDEEASVTNADQLNSNVAPVVTRQLASGINFFIDYYVDALDTYGFIKPLAEGLKGRPRIAQGLQRRFKEELYGTGEYSVASTAKRMLLPRIQTGEILYRGAPENKAHIVADHALGTVFVPIAYSGVVKLANAMNSYGKTSALLASNPDSFPTHGWYSASQRVAHPTVCPRTTTWCSSYKNLYRSEYQVTQLMRTGGTMRHIGVRPVDSKPAWNNAWYEKPYGAMGINFKNDFNWFITGPAVFDWEVRTMGLDSPYRTWDVGPGAWVKEHRGTANRKTLERVPFLMGGPR